MIFIYYIRCTSLCNFCVIGLRKNTQLNFREWRTNNKKTRWRTSRPWLFTPLNINSWNLKFTQLKIWKSSKSPKPPWFLGVQNRYVKIFPWVFPMFFPFQKKNEPPGIFLEESPSGAGYETWWFIFPSLVCWWIWVLRFSSMRQRPVPMWTWFGTLVVLKMGAFWVKFGGLGNFFGSSQFDFTVLEKLQDCRRFWLIHIISTGDVSLNGGFFCCWSTAHFLRFARRFTPRGGQCWVLSRSRPLLVRWP